MVASLPSIGKKDFSKSVYGDKWSDMVVWGGGGSGGKSCRGFVPTIKYYNTIDVE